MNRAYLLLPARPDIAAHVATLFLHDFRVALPPLRVQTAAEVLSEMDRGIEGEKMRKQGQKSEERWPVPTALITSNGSVYGWPYNRYDERKRFLGEQICLYVPTDKSVLPQADELTQFLREGTGRVLLTPDAGRWAAFVRQQIQAHKGRCRDRRMVGIVNTKRAIA